MIRLHAASFTLKSASRGRNRSHGSRLVCQSSVRAGSFSRYPLLRKVVEQLFPMPYSADKDSRVAAVSPPAVAKPSAAKTL